MTSDQIWVQANEHRDLIRSIYHSLCEGRDINAGMNQLKHHIPCLFGIDADQRALVFRSTDDGMVAVFVEEQGNDFVLALTTENDIEYQEGSGIEMQ